MIYLLTSVISLAIENRRYSITRFMLVLFLASSIGAYLVGRQHAWDEETIVLIIYTSFLLLIIFYSYKNYCNIRRADFCGIKKERLILCEKIITIVSVFTLVVEIYILYRVVGFLLIGMTTADGLKNGDGTEQDDIYGQIIPHFYLTLCHLLSPIGYLNVSLHFYYLINNNRKKASKYLILSLIIVLHGLIGLSRSITVVFLLTYFCFFYYVIPILDSKTKKIYIFRFLLILSFLVMIFMIISNSRFEKFYTKRSNNTAIIDEQKNPVLFSLVDYFVQWNEIGTEYMKKRPDGLMFYGWYNSAGLPIMIDWKIFGNSSVNEQREKEVVRVIESFAGDLWWQFQGCIARLTYEWGYLGTILFVFLFYYLMNRYSPQSGLLKFWHLLSLPILLPMGLMFWCGIGLGGLDVQMGMVYSFIMYKAIKKRSDNAVKKWK